jgi:hypothetical protein
LSLHELGLLRLVFTVGVPVLALAVPGWWLARRPGRHARDAAAHHAEQALSSVTRERLAYEELLA